MISGLFLFTGGCQRHKWYTAYGKRYEFPYKVLGGIQSSAECMAKCEEDKAFKCISVNYQWSYKRCGLVKGTADPERAKHHPHTDFYFRYCAGVYY